MVQVSDLNDSKPKRVKKGYAIPLEIAELIDTHKYVTEGREIDFIIAAIRNYCADIDGEKSVDIVCERMAKLFRAELNNYSNRMAHMLFKIAVEIAIQNYLLAAGYVNLDDDEMRYVRNNATNSVRKSRGIFSFEEALERERELRDGQ